MNKLNFSLLALAALLAFNANAIVISEDKFQSHGGDLNDVNGTIMKAMEPQVERSKEIQFLASGMLVPDGGGVGSGTWIGDSKDGKSMFVLTCGHCTASDESEGGGVFTFTDWSGKVVAKGESNFNITPYRKNKPDGLGGASTDIAIVQIPKLSDILDKDGNKISKPIIYDYSDKDTELNKVVWLGAYGLWGVGLAGPASIDEIRAMGASTVTLTLENDHAIRANFDAKNGNNQDSGVVAWANAMPGDSGSPWWQEHDGLWTIVGVTSSTDTNFTNATRTSKYDYFIKSVYSDALFFSQVIKGQRALP